MNNPFALFMHSAVASDEHRDHLRPSLARYMENQGRRVSRGELPRPISNKHNWSTYFREVKNDVGLPERMLLIQMMIRQGVEVVYAANVPVTFREEVHAFLLNHGIAPSLVTLLFKPESERVEEPARLDKREVKRKATYNQTSISRHIINILEQQHRNGRSMIMACVTTVTGLSPFLKDCWPFALTISLAKPKMDNYYARPAQAQEGTPAVATAPAVGCAGSGDLPSSQLPDEADHSPATGSGEEGSACG